MRHRPRVAVIGAGWAGCAAAVELAPHAQVTVLEAGRVAGGRARRTRVDDATLLDNGQHLLLGAYADTLRLMRQVGADPDRLFLRLPLALDTLGGVGLELPRWPAPWHTLAGLLRMRGVNWRERAALLLALSRLQLRGWRVPLGLTVAAWLAANRQSATLIDGFWTPLVLAALNTPVDSADMQVLACVLRDSLAGGSQAGDLLLPRVDLSALWPEPALAWLAGHGHAVRLGARVDVLESTASGVRVDGEDFDAAVLAVAPAQLERLIRHEPALAGLAMRVNQFRYQPIYTVYLRAEQAAAMPRPMLGLAGGFAQWLFNRGQLDGHDGWLAAVISGPGPHEALPHDELGCAVAAEIMAALPQLGRVSAGRVIAEKRATFSCDAGLVRPANATALPQLVLAGDYTAGDYPATLEGAMRSGMAAARLLTEYLPIKPDC